MVFHWLARSAFWCEFYKIQRSDISKYEKSFISETAKQPVQVNDSWKGRLRMQRKRYFLDGNHYDLIGHLFLMVVGAIASTVSADDIYPVSRRGGLPNHLWASAGVPGGRPQVMTIYTTLSPGMTLSQLNGAIAACPSNQVVQLAAGRYELGGVINLTKDGVVLRGAVDASGFPKTILQNACIQTSPYWYPGGPGGGWPSVSVRTVTSVLTEGCTSLSVSATPGADFTVNDVMMLDQLDDGILVRPDNQADVFKRNGRSYGLPLHITNVNGNAISFEPPLLGTYWNLNLTPQVVGWSSQLGATAKRIGLENVDIETCGNIYTVRLGPSYASWVRNVRVQATYAAGIRASYMVNCEINHNLFHDSTGTGSGTYAMIIGVDTACRFEDNIFSNLSLAMPVNSAVGCSISYNYGTGPYPYSPSGWLAEYIFTHGGHNHHTLLEGNWLDGPIYLDALFGNSDSFLGIVRNRVRGWASGKTANTTPITLEAYKNNITIVGNLLGEKNYHTSYSQMYSIDETCSGTIRTNNYNTVNDAVPASEAIGANTMQASYAYKAKPQWFGDRPWPPFSPTSFSSAAATNIPAGYRSVFGREAPAVSANQPPVAGASAMPIAGGAPLMVKFSSASSYDPEGVSLTYAWTFGDGATATAANPNHTYESPGTYGAQLKVSDGANSSSSSVLTIRATSVSSNQPTVGAASATPTD